jgi:hypothetical protein
MSTGNKQALPMAPGSRGYEGSRLNAVRHGILSRHLVLPWEDPSEYDDLMDSLVAEHRPNGPTEHHLVEELAGVIWRKQRLTTAEASTHRAGLHRTLEENLWDYDPVPARALAHLVGGEPAGSAAAAIRATPEDAQAELRDVADREAMTARALAILRTGRAEAYNQALAALREDTRKAWAETLEGPTDAADDGTVDEPYRSDAPGLRRFLENEIMPWYARRRRELEARDLIRAQAFGEALEPHRLERLARYEVHLDRKLERILGMLLKLQELRRTITPNAAA